MKKWFVVVIMVWIAVPAMAQIYKWKDADGNVHFSDSPHEGAQTVHPHKINSYDQVTYKSVGNVNLPAAHGNLIMYGATWCKYCKRARKYFLSHGISFTEYYIDKNKRAKREYDQLGATGVPVIIMGYKRMNGFSVAGFKKFYGK